MGEIILHYSKAMPIKRDLRMSPSPSFVGQFTALAALYNITYLTPYFSEKDQPTEKKPKLLKKLRFYSHNPKHTRPFVNEIIDSQSKKDKLIDRIEIEL